MDTEFTRQSICPLIPQSRYTTSIWSIRVATNIVILLPNTHGGSVSNYTSRSFVIVAVVMPMTIHLVAWSNRGTGLGTIGIVVEVLLEESLLFFIWLVPFSHDFSTWPPSEMFHSSFVFFFTCLLIPFYCWNPYPRSYSSSPLSLLIQLLLS